MQTLAISNNTEFNVKFTIKDGKILKTFAFTLMAIRLEQAEVTARLEDVKDGSRLKEFLAEVITGWSGQRLVLDEAGQPADFSHEGLDLLLNVIGVAGVCFSAYFKDCGAKEKN